MKKFVSILLALSLVLSLAACGGSKNNETTPATESTPAPETTAAPTDEVLETEAPTDAPVDEEMGVEPVDPASLEGIINAIYEIQPVEFMTGNHAIDLTDTSEEGLWTLKSFTGLENADLINEAVASESMIGSIAYSLVLVRVNDAADAQTVAENMSSGIDQRKWVCVEADDLMVAGSGDVVMLVMIKSENGTAQSYVDAFSTVMGGTDFAQ